MTNFFRALTLGCAFFLTTVSAGFVMAVTLNVASSDTSKVLLGASGVEVGGKLYDVSFVNGTCVGLFDGCDDAADFTFQTSADALAAHEALFSTVFTDSSLGNFLSGAAGDRIIGCTTATCTSIVAYAPPTTSGGTVLISWRNRFGGGLSGIGSTQDSSSVTSNTYAVWSTATPVPLPAGFPLMLAGLGAFYWLRRRQV